MYTKYLFWFLVHVLLWPKFSPFSDLEVKLSGFITPFGDFLMFHDFLDLMLEGELTFQASKVLSKIKSSESFEIAKGHSHW